MIEVPRAEQKPKRRAALLTIEAALRREPVGYLVGAFVTAVSTGLALAAAPYAALAHVMVIYLLGAVLVATRYGVGASTFTIAVSALCFDYFNIPPIFAFAIPDPHSVATLVGMLITAIVMCSLLQRLRHQRTLARNSEARTLALCELSLDLSAVATIDELSRAARPHLEHLFGPNAAVLVGDARTLELTNWAEIERTTAGLAFERSELRVLELDGATLAFQPITNGREALGLVRVALGSASGQQREQRVLLAACADRVAVAIDRIALGNAARQAHVEAEAERLRNELLSAMSHDLRTPLASILTAGTTLLNPASTTDGVRRELLETIVDETERLNRLVTDLLSVTRLESGRVELNKAPEALDELVYDVLARLSSRLEGREVAVEAPDDLPFVAMDPVLVSQVLVNLIENVLRYTPAGSPLALRIVTTEHEVRLEVADRGPGIPSEEHEKVFEKFYRGSLAKLKDGGSGLGLTICRAVARAHGGRIQIGNRPGGGTIVEFVLPVIELEHAASSASLLAQEAHA
ncbi:MAG TPA: ATP-binding protein [Polyangiaceae bacterium]|nr:ATP-binding protein [Polyangiaceae bacterium]